MKLFGKKKLSIIIMAIIVGLGFTAYRLYEKAGTFGQTQLMALVGTTIIAIIITIISYNHKLKTQKNIVSDNQYEKFSVISKVVLIILIINGCYELSTINYNNDYENKRQIDSKNWTNKDKRTLIETCLRDSKAKESENYNIVLDYCICSTQSVTSAISYESYMNNLEKSQEDQLKIIMPLIQNCRDEMNRRLDSANHLELTMPKKAL